MATTLRPGERVKVFIDNRHDFIRYAIVLSVYQDEVMVRYEDGQVEVIPSRWID